MTFLLIIGGFTLLLLGGEGVVRGSVSLADRLGVSPLVIGLTIVGFGTSLPEMVVSVNAALAGAPGIAVGNVIGSNIANTMMVLGAAAVVSPIMVNPRALRRDTACMVVATVVFICLGLSGKLVWWHGAFLLVVLAGYVSQSVWNDIRTGGPAAELRREEAREAGVATLRIPTASALVVIGMGAVITGAEWLVTGATDLARLFNVPDEIIGLTIIAIGTSLPELATSLVAAFRGHPDVCLGNILGSNLFNLFGIAGVTALFADLPFSEKAMDFDLWILLGTAILLISFMFSGRRLSRIEGGVLVALYSLYVSAQFLGIGSLT